MSIARFTRVEDLQADQRAVVWLGVAFALYLLVGAAVALGLVAAGENPRAALRATSPAQTLRLFRGTSGVDSWEPMLRAYDIEKAGPSRSMYDLFFVDHVKFQYPPTSLLFFDLLPRSMTASPEGRIAPSLRRLLSLLSLAALLVTALVSALVLELRLFQLMGRAGRHAALRVLLSLFLALSFYPLAKAYDLGQVQILLGCLLALAVLFQLLGWDLVCGVCFGICCLVKPLYGGVLLWSLLRRRWRVAVGLAGVVLLGLIVSVARFGLSDHWRYLRVLQAISRTGEAFWPNQSLNGILNRLLHNGDAAHFSPNEFAPYDPIVYSLTLASSLLLLGLALWPGRGWRAVATPASSPRSPIDLMIVLVALTIASPVAWEHHYGAFLPIYAVAVPDLIRARPFARWTGPLFACSYVATASAFVLPRSMLAHPWLGLAGSHLFFGGLVLFILLLVLRAAGSRTSPPSA